MVPKQSDPTMASMDVNMDAPIALRKSKRRSSAVSPSKPRVVSDSAMQQKTPSTRRSKRVRFSDPGLFSPSSHATSLTPAFRRASLGTPRQRRPATPSRHANTDDDHHVQFTPFRQVLDERCQRRIRRNGLSDEQNQFEAEKKSHMVLLKEIEHKDEELKKLKAELEEEKQRKLGTPRKGWFQPPAHTQSSQQRVQEVEAELDALRRSFAIDDTPALQEWDHVPTGVSGPHSDSGDTILIHEDDDADFAMDTVNRSEAASMGLELEAARQAKTSFLGSFADAPTNFDFDFADSPVRQGSRPVSQIPETPVSHFQDLSKQLKSTTNRAEEAELAFEALTVELRSLGFGEDGADGLDIIEAIQEHFRQARLELERQVPGETPFAFDNTKVLPELVKKLQALADTIRVKDQDLKNAKDQHHNLTGNFEKAIVAAEKANAHIQKLEEALDAAAEECLDARMRAQNLERDLNEKEADITSLKSALDKYRTDITRLESLITDLETSHQTTDTTQTAKFNEQLEEISDLTALAAAEQHGRRAAEASAVARLSTIQTLQSELESTRAHASSLETTLTALQASAQRNSTDDATHIGALNARLASLATALASANAEVDKLRITKTKLEERVRHEIEQGARTVEMLQEQFIRAVTKTNAARKSYVNGAKIRVANWELAEEREASSDGVDEPRTPSSAVRFAEWADVRDLEGEDGHNEAVQDDADGDHVPGSVEVGRGRSRDRKKPRLVTNMGVGVKSVSGPNVGKRRYDSGIGMSDDEEMQVQESGLMTPELSSEGDWREGQQRELGGDMMH